MLLDFKCLKEELHFTYLHYSSDINECLDEGRCKRELELPNNSIITYCVNIPGSYECKCIDGYRKKGGTCIGKSSQC